MGYRLSDSGADWENYERGLSDDPSEPRDDERDDEATTNRLVVDPVEAVEALQALLAEVQATVFDVHVTTQYLENYGDAHKPYWKPKGGDTTILYRPGGLTQADVEAVVAAVRSQLEWDNPVSCCYIIDVGLVPTGTLTQDELNQQEFDGEILSPATRIRV